MGRWAGLMAGVTASTMAIASSFACDLDLKPFVDPVDSGPPIGDTIIDGGPNTIADGGVDVSAPGLDASEAGKDGSKHVFVTSTKFEGALGGVAGANAKCNQLAEDAKLEGRFIAWLSVPNDAVLGRLTSDGPWLLVDKQTVVFANKAAITVGPAVPIDRTEKGDRVQGAEDLVWTGTKANGEPAPEILQSCANFALSTGTGLAGAVEKKNDEWTQAANAKCTTPNRLYCFEL